MIWFWNTFLLAEQLIDNLKRDYLQFSVCWPTCIPLNRSVDGWPVNICLTFNSSLFMYLFIIFMKFISRVLIASKRYSCIIVLLVHIICISLAAPFNAVRMTLFGWLVLMIFSRTDILMVCCLYNSLCRVNIWPYNSLYRVNIWPYNSLYRVNIWPHNSLSRVNIWPYNSLCRVNIWPYNSQCRINIWPYNSLCNVYS